MNCRHCNKLLSNLFIDLGVAPPSNAYLSNIYNIEPRYPLKIFVCDNCWLVQTEDFSAAETIFTEDYAYFSSVSKSWVLHAKLFCEKAIKKFNLNRNSFVVELASNDGYLLKNFVENSIPCLGVEPTIGTALEAEKKQINVLKEFFNLNLASLIAEKYKKADLIIANNVIAHVPDINDFIKGMKLLLNNKGTISIEFPHLMQLIEKIQFDTIYHEHYSYFSLSSIVKIFSTFGLKVYDVEKIATHGGSLRILSCHSFCDQSVSPNVQKLIDEEIQFGITNFDIYQNFQKSVVIVKNDISIFFKNSKAQKKRIVGYGAAAKGNTLLNYCGITSNDIEYIVDNAKSKQGKYTPGSHIPILDPQIIKETKPDYIIIFPWNIREEIISNNLYIYDWGGKFVFFAPYVNIL